MNLIIYGKNMQLTEAIKQYIKEKIGRIELFFEEPLNANIHVNVFLLKNKQCIEINIALHHTFIRVEAHSDDLYKSIDIAEEKMKRQIRKYKTKLNRKVRHQTFINQPEVEAKIPVTRKPSTREPRRFYKPMNAEEAILQMNAFKLDHLYYFDDLSDELRAVYKTSDGNYGLITPNDTEIINQVG